jgi:glucose-1-phosphate cytidylyltransferase
MSRFRTGARIYSPAFGRAQEGPKHGRRPHGKSLKVVLFCGGRGLRMGESSASIPKPMVPIGNRPVLWHIMKYYAHFGHTDFVLCLGHKGEVIKDFFLKYDEALSNDFVLSNGGRHVELLRSDISDWRITFVDTGLHATVGQRLRAVRHYLEEDELFLASYGDGLTDAPLPHLISELETRRKTALFLCVKPSSYSFHTVSIKDGELVQGIQNIAHSDVWINGGFFVFRREIFEYLEAGEDLIEQPFQRLIDRKQLIASRYDGFWAPMDTLKDKHNLEDMLENGRAPWRVWDEQTTAEPRRDSA